MVRELAVFATGLPLSRDVDYISLTTKGEQPLWAMWEAFNHSWPIGPVIGSTPGLRRLGSRPGPGITRTLRMQGVSNPEVGYRKM